MEKYLPYESTTQIVLGTLFLLDTAIESKYKFGFNLRSNKEKIEDILKIN